MSRRTPFFTAALILLCCTAASAQPATRGEKPRAGSANAAAAAPPPIIAVDAPGVRLAGLIRRDGTVARQKNIQAVNRIGTGTFCITPKAGTFPNIARVVVTLTPEYYYSLYNEVKVQWAVQGSGCAASQIGVYTMADANLDGVYSLSNSVGFSITIP